MNDNGTQTIGVLRLYDSQSNKLLEFDALELSYNNNERQISCIKTGVYIVERNVSFRHGIGFRLPFVMGRDNILIHKGNFNTDTKGCVLIGHGFRDINFDEDLDVLNSALAMKQLLAVLRTTTTIEIQNGWE